MPSAAISNKPSAAAAIARRWARCKSGIAAVEFGLLVPIMLCMFIGVVELSQAITVSRRVSNIASSTADLVARQKTTNATTLNSYMAIISELMSPYSATPMMMTISNVYNTTAAPLTNRVCWFYHRNNNLAQAANAGLTSGGTYTGLPPGILDSVGGTSVVVVEVSYLYQPILLFNAIGSIHGTKTSSFIGTSGITMSEKFYLKPRLSASIQYAGQSACI
jgi:Flp pilus assembly protein TadG